MNRSLLRRVCPLLLCAVAALRGAAAAPEVKLDAATRLPPGAPEWRDLAATLARKPDTLTGFTELRFFPFKKEPVRLAGDVRVSAERGLSLHYREPEERIVIFDRQGMLIREPAGQKAVPSDPRANAANAALLHILQFDFPTLEQTFELFGRREGPSWALGLVPRDAAMRRNIGEIHVAGTADAVRRIELRRSAKQRIEIEMAEGRTTSPFPAEDVKRFFR